MLLNKKHRDVLKRECGLSDETIAELERYGWHSAPPSLVAKILGWMKALCGALVITYPNVPGFVRVRLDKPIKDADGREIRYMTPKGGRNYLYVPIRVASVLNDPTVTLHITEGEKKAEKATQEGFPCVGLAGVWSWLTKATTDGKKGANSQPLPELKAIAWKDREVVVILDSDARENQQVRKAGEALCQQLAAWGARPRLLVLPALDGKGKTGLDDFLVAKGAEGLRLLLDVTTDDKATPETPNGPGWWPHAAAEEIAAKHHLLCTTSAQWYRYAEGYWQPKSYLAMRDLVQHHLGRSARSYKITEALDLLGGHVRCEEEDFNRNRYLLNFTDGLFDVRTGALISHTPDVRSTMRLPYPYIPTAPCLRWMRFLEEVFPGETDKQRFLQEWYGYCLVPDASQDKCLFMVGEGANGKSVALTVLKALVGAGNVCSVDVDGLHSAFQRAELYGKLVGISAEVSTRAVVRDKYLKQIISGDMIGACRKYQNPFDFSPFVRLVFAMNTLPRVNDPSNGFYRKLLILRFHRVFERHEQDKRLREKLLGELSGIFNWAYEGLRRLEAQGEFTEVPDMDLEVEEYRGANSPVMRFVRECCVIGDERQTFTAQLYKAFIKWCETNGVRNPPESNVFGREVRRCDPKIGTAHRNKANAIKGIALKADFEE